MRNIDLFMKHFDGYLDGLQYALAVVQRAAEEEDAHGNP